MYMNSFLAVCILLAGESYALPVGATNRDDSSVNWYADSATGVADSLDFRDETVNWYADSAAGVEDSLEEKRTESVNWYSDSASGIADTLSGKRTEESSWYRDSASGIVDSLSGKRATLDHNWYADSSSGSVNALDKKEIEEKTNWYADSAEGVAGTLQKKGDSANWYADSTGGVSKSLDKKDDVTNWYADSAGGVASTLHSKRRSLSTDGKASYERALRNWIYHDFRGKPLRESSERGKSFFTFTPHPRSDVVARWHVPAELRDRFDSSEFDAEKVSILNYYLLVTGREPRSAEDLGFVPTKSAPGLTETNEVGFGYAFAGQHQLHCVDFVADAIDIGKGRLNDFYLKHTIHCLGLLKYLAPQLTMKQPTSFLLPAANQRLLDAYPQTMEVDECR